LAASGTNGVSIHLKRLIQQQLLSFCAIYRLQVPLCRASQCFRAEDSLQDVKLNVGNCSLCKMQLHIKGYY